MAELLKPDICVIGAGSGGLSVAAGAAAFGASVVLVEKGRMGGDCLNCGCVPSKALIAAAKRANAALMSGKFGVDLQPVVDFSRVYSHVHKVIAAVTPNDSIERFTGLGVRVVAGRARFTDPATVMVDGSITVQARRFVIATGSSPAVPPIPGLAQAPYRTNETIFDLEELPAHLVVIGGGPGGLELGQAFRRLGAQVTVIEAERPLAKDDAECAQLVLAALLREGVEIRAPARVQSVRQTSGGIELAVRCGDAEERIAGSHLLVSAGRAPNVMGLGLEEAKIEFTPAGIVVDGSLQTTNRRVYATGDAVAGGMMFTHVANYHAGLVIRHALLRLPVKARYNALPRVTFTDPELAHVGLTDEQARDEGYRIRVMRWPYCENDRAQTERTTDGHVKVVTTAGGGVLGATIVGAHAGELIAPWTLAIGQGLNIRAIAEMVAPYPTLSELNKRAAMMFFAPVAANPTVRRMIRWLRRG
ncbi:MAG TPA: FAD-dependent oxidoreductase [Xanthobacteraceae bacterium]|nr:FAD-dependent oxidoreductase [Xanthobacteraceae bacterium]